MASNKKTVFNSNPPIDGGNSAVTQAVINALSKNIDLGINKKDISEALSKTNLNFNKTYNVWWLLQFQADYFANLVNFKFDNYQVNRQVSLAIRLGIIYGSSVLWKRGNKLTAMYVNNMELDEAGYPKRVKMYRGDMVLMNQNVDISNQILDWVERDVENDENFFVFMPHDVNLGGLLKWMPFLNQFETLLKMLNTHSYAYLKSILYNVKNKKSFIEDIELYFNAENPFLINSGSDKTLTENKFKEFEIFKQTNNTDGLIQYINDFLNIYYDLIGRRYNSDRKPERNISNEVDASQENYDVLQRPIIRNINYLLEYVEQKWGWKNLLKNQAKEAMEESDDDIKPNEAFVEGENDNEQNEL